MKNPFLVLLTALSLFVFLSPWHDRTNISKMTASFYHIILVQL